MGGEGGMKWGGGREGEMTLLYLQGRGRACDCPKRHALAARW